MKADILTLETAKRIADLERDVLYYKEIRDEAIANNVKLREEKLLLEKRTKDLQVKLNCKEYFSSTMPENTEFVILTKENYDRQQKDIELELIDYKSRIDKAIEYLEQQPVIEINGEYRNIYAEDDNKLLNILNGDDE